MSVARTAENHPDDRPEQQQSGDRPHYARVALEILLP
jgi:hypothetical protein